MAMTVAELHARIVLRVRSAEHTQRGYDESPDYDAFWKQRDYLRLAHKVKVPALVAHGLQDGHSASRCCSAFDALDGSAAELLRAAAEPLADVAVLSPLVDGAAAAPI